MNNSSKVIFRDFNSGEILIERTTNWKFEVGQVFEGFWGCNSIVRKVKLGMELDDYYNEKTGRVEDDLLVVQNVYVERIPLKF